jgi:uncharacterized protein YjdB
LPVNTTNKNVAWSSSNPGIATIDSSGLVTVVSKGNVVIKAVTTDGSNKTASYALTPPTQPILATSISVLPITIDMVNKTATLTATITPSNTTNKTVYWLSGNTNIVKVNPYTGLVTAVSPGSAYVGGFMMDGSNKYSIAVVSVLAKPSIKRMQFHFT